MDGFALTTRDRFESTTSCSTAAPALAFIAGYRPRLLARKARISDFFQPIVLVLRRNGRGKPDSGSLESRQSVVRLTGNNLTSMGNLKISSSIST